MAGFSPQQQAFIGTYSRLTGLNPGVVSAQVAAEEPVGAKSGYHGTQDWLNVGITDSGPMGAGNPAWRNPVQAAKLAAAWATGKKPVPGFGTAAPSIVNAIHSTAGKSPQAQIAALQRSGWASSGYPNLPALFSQYGHNTGVVGANGMMTPTIPSRPTTQTIPGTKSTTLDSQALAAALFSKLAAKPISDHLSSESALNDYVDAANSGKYNVTTSTPSTKVTVPGAHPATSSSESPHVDLPTKPGITPFDGKPVANWIAPILKWATQHGWGGTVSSGYRSYSQQLAIYNSGVRPAAKPGTSNHEMTGFPGGAVDVTEAQQLSDILAKSPYAGKLVWAGSKDPVHFSHPHNGSY